MWRATLPYVTPIKGIYEGTEPVVDNFENRNIVPDGVLLSFEDYQVGPHSFGQPEFVVPFSALRGSVQQSRLKRLFASNKTVK
jgi:hypothetical protein